MADKRILKLMRVATIPASIDIFCRGLLKQLKEEEGYDVIVVASPGKEMKTISEREGVECIEVPMERRISPLRDIVSLFRMIKAVRRTHPDIIHSITPKAGLLSMTAGWICRVPVRLHTFTGLVFPTATGLKRQLLVMTDRLTCKLATHIVPEGEGVKTDLINNKITSKPLKVLGFGNIRGIDIDHYNPENTDVEQAAEKLRRRDLTTFVFVGRLVREKGIDELVEAFMRLHKKYPSTRLILVGEEERLIDPLRKETIEAINTEKAIIKTGFQEDVRHWLAASDVLVFPSWREGFPNVVIEAGALGIPSIVTDINGSRDIVSNGENGLVIPPRNANAIFDAMEKMTTDSKLRERLGSKSRPMVTSRYEQKFVRKCLTDYYKEIQKK